MPLARSRPSAQWSDTPTPASTRSPDTSPTATPPHITGRDPRRLRLVTVLLPAPPLSTDRRSQSTAGIGATPGDHLGVGSGAAQEVEGVALVHEDHPLSVGAQAYGTLFSTSSSSAEVATGPEPGAQRRRGLPGSDRPHHRPAPGSGGTQLRSAPAARGRGPRSPLRTGRWAWRRLPHVGRPRWQQPPRRALQET